MKTIDLGSHRVLTGKNLEAAVSAGAREVVICDGVVLTPTARDVIRRTGLVLISNHTGGASPAPARQVLSPAPEKQAPPSSRPLPLPSSRLDEAILNSPEALPIKEEIVRVGKKLWDRQYVDGNGGNITYRITENRVICTPTLLSKADLTVDDLCLVDLEGNQLAGKGKRTSEAYLHLEIYKTVPEARAAVHAHPPHATAYAITGRVPPTCVIPEQDVFVGAVAISPYETPGTREFARTITPYAKDHNTILLANHGVICWADTPTHAEWYVEIVDTYCRTLMLAAQLGAPVTRIPPDKKAVLLEIKKRLGLPDAQFGLEECQLCDQPETTGGITVCPTACPHNRAGRCGTKSQDLESLIKTIT
ncbi:MAG: class II aldolase/adducin family protein, partial [Acidobacteria bacterium]|nr:class II aldolase/adducin family protein [Acidobacteriota bacterium]